MGEIKPRANEGATGFSPSDLRTLGAEDLLFRGAWNLEEPTSLRLSLSVCPHKMTEPRTALSGEARSWQWAARPDLICGPEDIGQDIGHLPPHDALTGLPSTHAIVARLDDLVRRPRLKGRMSAVVLIDIHAFSDLVQNAGTIAGDLLLRHVTSRLLGRLRETDLLARVGPSRFALVVADADSAESIEALCRRLIAVVQDPFDLLGQTKYIALAFAVSLLSDEISSTDDLLDQTEAALQRASADGPNSVRFTHADIDRKLQRQRCLARDLSDALAANQLDIHDEPQFRVVDRALIGLSIGPRWTHPAEGVLTGGIIAKLAEDNGLSDLLFQRVLAASRRSLGRRHPHSLASLRLTLDLPAPALISDDLRGIVERHLEQLHHVSPDHLVLAISEAAFATLRSVQLECLLGLRRIGARISLTSFGSFDAALARLTNFPFDQIDVDVGGLHAEQRVQPVAKMMEAALSIAAGLGIETSARGVESEAQLDWLASLNCTLAQGPLLAGPTMPDRIEAAPSPPDIEFS